MEVFPSTNSNSLQTATSPSLSDEFELVGRPLQTPSPQTAEAEDGQYILVSVHPLSLDEARESVPTTTAAAAATATTTSTTMTASTTAGAAAPSTPQALSPSSATLDFFPILPASVVHQDATLLPVESVLYNAASIDARTAHGQSNSVIDVAEAADDDNIGPTLLPIEVTISLGPARCPHCNRVFAPRCPEIKWQCVHAHLRSCNPGLRAKLVVYNPNRDNGTKYACPVCPAAFKNRCSGYEHICGVADAKHAEFRRETCSRKWIENSANRTAKGREHTKREIERKAAKERAAAERQRNGQLAKLLYSAAKGGNAAEVAHLLQGSAFNADQGGEDGFTPLMTAAEAGHTAVVSLLLNSPHVQPNRQNTYGQTALSFAAQNGRKDTVAELIRSRRVSVFKTTGGKTASQLARGAGHHAVAEMIEAAMRQRSAEKSCSGRDAHAANDLMDDGIVNDATWTRAEAAGEAFLKQMLGQKWGSRKRKTLNLDTRAACWTLRPKKATTRNRWPEMAVSMRNPLVRAEVPDLAVMAATAAMISSSNNNNNNDDDDDDDVDNRDNRDNKKTRSKRMRSSSSLGATREPRVHFSRETFLARHEWVVQNEFPSATIVPFDVCAEVVQRLARASEIYGVFPEVGFHGSRRRNLDSIRARGLLNPAKHSFIPSNIPGVYTTTPGNGWYSRGYTDTTDVLVCGIVVPPQHMNNSDEPSKNRRKKAAALTRKDRKANRKNTSSSSCRVGQHRNHHRAGVVAVSNKGTGKKKKKKTASTTPSRLCPLPPMPPVVEYSGIRVVHDESLVAPLFVAKGAYGAVQMGAYPYNRGGTVGAAVPVAPPIPLSDEPGQSPNKKGAGLWVGRHRTYVEKSDQAVWLPPTAVADSIHKHAKRRHQKKLRDADRAACRAAKRSACML